MHQSGFVREGEFKRELFTTRQLDEAIKKCKLTGRHLWDQ